MVEHTSAHVTARDWRMILLTGGISIAVSYALFHFVLPVGTWISIAPESIVSTFSAAVIAMLAMAITTAFFAQRLRVHNLRMRIAINNMSQGLCMFDTDSRLIVCNRRYAEMYALPPELTAPGTAWQDIIAYCAGKIESHCYRLKRPYC